MKTSFFTSIVIAFVFLSAPICLLGQDKQHNENKEEKIRSLEIAYISRKLNLSTEEAQKFWPIFNEYKSEMQTINGGGKNRNEVDVLGREEKVLEIKKRYNERFTKAVGSNKSNQFFQAEHEFKGVLLNRIKQKPGGRPGGRQRIKK